MFRGAMNKVILTLYPNKLVKEFISQLLVAIKEV